MCQVQLPRFRRETQERAYCCRLSSLSNGLGHLAEHLIAVRRCVSSLLNLLLGHLLAVNVQLDTLGGDQDVKLEREEFEKLRYAWSDSEAHSVQKGKIKPCVCFVSCFLGLKRLVFPVSMTWYEWLELITQEPPHKHKHTHTHALSLTALQNQE